ncbi:hypothetical protein [Sphingopyxis sp. KK2]|uniref:hypothetical protein n=1 Tax=Sphingopyxis sp. KK2 TaxID=1855727 RepID=UPI001181BFBA|nr:hypothetical protein [Sphingopyxis sp. KK2]
MGAWLERHFAWNGRTSRDGYRRWLPLIIAVEIASFWGVAAYGRRGVINVADFGWWGLLLLAIWLPYAICWNLLTARRLRTAGITRRWLLIPVFVQAPIGDSLFTVGTAAIVILIVVAALADDAEPVTIA